MFPEVAQAAEWEWRGIVTVNTLQRLRDFERIFEWS